MPVPVTGHCQGVDRVDGPAGGMQGGDQEAAGGLDGHGRRGFGCVTVLCEQLNELLQTIGGVIDASARPERA